MKCKELKLRTKKGVKYLYCTALKKEITWNDCKGCLLKNYPAVRQFVKSNPKVVKKRPKRDISSKTRGIVIDRDHHICRLCGKWDSHHLHHIIYRSEDRSLINEPTNLITLCVECHLMVHKNKRYWQPKLQDKIKELY